MKKKILIFPIAALIAIIALWNNNTTVVIRGNQTIDDNFILSNGTISPGNSPGKITVTGDFTMGNTAKYKCELKDLTGAGTGHDQIDVSGSVTLDGTLDVVLDGYTPNDNDAFEIMKYGTTVSGTFSTITGLPANWQIDYGVKAPNKITIYGPTSPLPVELFDFYADKRNENVLLTWQTASEQNSDYFEIEHSPNAHDFKTIGKIKAQGTSLTNHKYSFTHKNAGKGINYYRLRQVDFDGKYVYSSIVSIKLGDTSFSFHPNPAKHTINLSQPCEVVVIYDLSGKEILRKEHVESSLNLSGIKTGIYLLDVNHGEYTQRLVIEK